MLHPVCFTDMTTSHRKHSENAQESLLKIASCLDEYLDEYSEDLYYKEEDGLVEFLMSKFKIRTDNYFERIFSIFIDNQWIEIHPSKIHICFTPLVNLMEKEYPWTKFYDRCEQYNYQPFVDKLSWALIQKLLPKKPNYTRVSSNKTLEILMEEIVIGTKFEMES